MADTEVDILEIVTLPATRGRISSPSQLGPPVIEPPAPRRHLGIVVVCLLVLGGIVLARTQDRPAPTEAAPVVPAADALVPRSPPTSVAASVSGVLGHGWQRWGGPSWLDTNGAVVAVGDQIVVVDGAHAAVLDLGRIRWRTIEPAPLPTSTFGARGLSSGERAIFWSGGVVASFDPFIDRWEVAHAPPGRPHLTDAVWANHELVFVGSQLGYRPDVDVWTFLNGTPDGTDWSSAWVGRDVVAVGHDATGPVAAAYNQRDGFWRTLSHPPLAGLGVSLARDGTRVIAVDGSGGAAAYDQYGGGWSPLPPTRTDGRICRVGIATVGITVMALTCDDVLVLAADGTWVADQGSTPRGGGRLNPVGDGVAMLAPIFGDGQPAAPTDPEQRPIVLWTYGP